MPCISVVVKNNKKHKTPCISVMSILTGVQETTVWTRLNFTFTNNSYHANYLIHDQFPQVVSPVPSLNTEFGEMSTHCVGILMYYNCFPYFLINRSSIWWYRPVFRRFVRWWFSYGFYALDLFAIRIYFSS